MIDQLVFKQSFLNGSSIVVEVVNVRFLKNLAQVLSIWGYRNRGVNLVALHRANVINDVVSKMRIRKILSVMITWVLKV
jgi:hypothetical protein